jgi:hypothetical protein
VSGSDGCEACGRRLFFHERVAWPSALCFPCSRRRGVIRMADQHRMRNLHTRAAASPRWWQWTAFLEHALLWDGR